MLRRGLSTPSAVVATAIILAVTALTFVYIRPPGTNSSTITTTINPIVVVTTTVSSSIAVTTTQQPEIVNVVIAVESQTYHDALVGVLVTASPSPYLVGNNSSVTNGQGEVTFSFNLGRPIQEKFTSSDSGHYPGSVTLNLGPNSGIVSTTIYEQCKSFNAVC